MPNLTYRVSTTPTVPTSNTAKGSPLTNGEIDGNFKSLSQEIDSTNTVVAGKAAISDVLAFSIALG